uniref:Pco088744 n=1 Tax=Arundo donax TaxID=35708 RepID=A0A0A9DN39_ARUDO
MDTTSPKRQMGMFLQGQQVSEPDKHLCHG